MKHLTGHKGFTVLELIVTLALGLILMAAAYGIYLSQHRGFEKVESATNLIQSARLSIEQLSRELHMAGFGVVTGQVFTEAKKYSLTFNGDVDTDINGILAEDAAIGATSIKVDLRDGRDVIDQADYIFLNGAGKVEMIKVRQSGEPVDFTVEPDVIYLNSALTNSYTAGATLLRSVESVRFAITFPSGHLTRNGELLAEDLRDLEFHYFNSADVEMTPDAVNGLSQLQRAAIRKVQVHVQVGTADGSMVRDFDSTVELRNLGTRSFTPDTCNPLPPTNLLVSETMCEHFTIAWTPPTTNACDGSDLIDLAGYKIYYGTASGVYLTPPSNVADETVSSHEVADVRLATSTTYYVTMRAYDHSFNESSNATEISFTLNDTQAPGPPTTLDAQSGVGTVTLTWEKPDEKDIKGYRLYRGTSPGFVANIGTRIADEVALGPEAITFVDQGLAPCNTYYYKISSVDCASEGTLSAEVFGDGPGQTADQPTAGTTNTTPTESPATPPAPPSVFNAAGRNQSVDLYWTNPTDNDLAGVLIRYSTVNYPSGPVDGTELNKFAGTPGQAMTYNHVNLSNGVTYYYSAFAYDRCGNYSSRITARATPAQYAPLVEIISPLNGTTITNGHMIFQARAYDPDKSTLSNPPSFAADNGKGIYSMSFNVNPNPGGAGFPHAEYFVEYCGFGGETNPCPSGDVSNWCDGTYQLYVSATDDELQSSTSPYYNVIIRNGGLYLDDTYVPTLGGTYLNEVTFQVKNTSGGTLTLEKLTATWDHQDARLKQVEIPSGTAVWTYSGTPATSGSVLEFPSYARPTIGAGSTRTVKLVFIRNATRLTNAAESGATAIQVDSATGFAAGDTIYLINGTTVESASVLSINGNQFILRNALNNVFPANSVVRHSAVAEDIQMTGTDLRCLFDFQKTTYGQVCRSDEMQIVLLRVPEIHNAQQDKPSLNLSCSTVLGQIQIENYRDVPVHVLVTDHGGVGITQVKAYYYVDHSYQTVAPGSGYASLTMVWDGVDSRWEATVPYQSDARVWLYFTALDGHSQTDRDPTYAAYAYDYVVDATPPACPLGLTATLISKTRIDLSWIANTEPDIKGYNIYRSRNCGSFTKVYTLIIDTDPNTPGVQYSDTIGLNTNADCYTYYITAVDMQGNESTPCQSFTAQAGHCPC